MMGGTVPARARGVSVPGARHSGHNGEGHKGIRGARNGLTAFRGADSIKQIFGSGMALRVGYVQGAGELRFQDCRQAFNHTAPGLGCEFLAGKLRLERGLAVWRKQGARPSGAVRRAAPSGALCGAAATRAATSQEACGVFRHRLALRLGVARLTGR